MEAAGIGGIVRVAAIQLLSDPGYTRYIFFTFIVIHGCQAHPQQTVLCIGDRAVCLIFNLPGQLAVQFAPLLHSQLAFFHQAINDLFALINACCSKPYTGHKNIAHSVRQRVKTQFCHNMPPSAFPPFFLSGSCRVPHGNPHSRSSNSSLLHRWRRNPAPCRYPIR